jgi:hypothetical protein
MSMPVFERDFHHKKVIEKVNKDFEFQLALHDKKKR